jgi:hypothetical protein
MLKHSSCVVAENSSRPSVAFESARNEWRWPTDSVAASAVPARSLRGVQLTDGEKEKGSAEAGGSAK